LDIRETLNRHSKVTATVVICCLAVGVVAIAMEMKGNNGMPPAKNYFSADDGQTWFVDSSLKLPPFDHDGAQAVRCYVFQGKNGKFAGLLQKFDSDTQAQLAKQPDQFPPRGTPVMVKKPGEKVWQKMGPDQESALLMHLTAPDGPDAEPVMP
jgi:hypothetical protein